MAKVVGYLAAVCALVVALLAPAWLQWDDDPGVAAARVAVEDLEPTTITDYVATFDLQPDGVLLVEEQVTVELPPYDVRTGLTRYFDRVDDSDEGARRRVEDVTATLDGEPATVDLERAGHGRFDAATIGDPDVALESGVHRYVISYRVADVLEPGLGDSLSSLHWELVPASWQQHIERAELIVTLPAPARDVRCGIGSDDAPLVCDDVTGQETDTLVVRAGPLPPHTPVRVRLGVAVPTPDTSRVPWAPRWDVALGQSLPALGLVLGGAALAGLVGLVLARRSRGRRSDVVPTEEPPAGLGPAQAAYALTGRTERSHYVAGLVLAGRHGAVDVTRRGAGWVVADRSGGYGWTGLDPVTSHVAHLLGGPASSFVVDATSAASGERLAAEVSSSGRVTEQWARDAGLVARARRSRLAAVLVVVGLVAAGAAAVWNPWSMTFVGLVPGVLALVLVPHAVRGSASRRTAAGRELRGRVAGFRRALAATGEERYDFTGREDRYAAHLPWAVALGCTEEWTEAFRASAGHEPPGVPSAADVADLDAAVAGAIATSEAARVTPTGGQGRRRRPGRRARRS